MMISTIILVFISILGIPRVLGQNVANVIDSLQASESLLLDPISTFATTYQSLAKSAAVGILRADSSTKTIRNFYVLACIYYATNGAENPRTQVAIPGCPVPTWTTDDWLFGTNYCTWHGVTCGDGDNNVVWIVLMQNNLHGSWPPEVVLLKEHLQRIDVSDNKLHYSKDPEWLSQMGELRHLSFGSTSWEYPGVPAALSGAVKLINLNISDSRWSGGPIRPQAFDTLTNLVSVDMGGNQYDTSEFISFPLASLPKLKDLYMNDCRFTPNLFDLSFLVDLPSLVTLRLDLTRFEGTIPTGIGDLLSLKTFSCAYCGLTAKIPTELGDLVNLQTLRLVGNDLTGTIPDTLGRLLLLKTLYLEANDLDSDAIVPNAVCELERLKKLGVDCTVKCACCSCCGEECGNLVDPTPAPTPFPTFLTTESPTTPFPTAAPTTAEHPTTPFPTATPTTAPPTNPPAPTSKPGTGPVAINPLTQAPSSTPTATSSPSSTPPLGSICFAGDAKVEVQHRGLLEMKDLRLGDMVMTAGNKYERIYSFGHKNDTVFSPFLQIIADGHSTTPLHISPDHMLFMADGHAVPASMIVPGNSLLLSSNHVAVVKTVRVVHRKGAYAPFTKSGTLIVNAFVASNYVAFQNSDYLLISSYKTPLTFQWIAHTFQSAQRLAVAPSRTLGDERYTESGVSLWVDIPHRTGSWLLDQHALIIILILLPCIAIFGLLSIVELLCESPFAMTIAIIIATMLFSFKCKFQHHYGSKQVSH